MRQWGIGVRQVLLPMQDSTTLMKSFVSMKGIHTLDS